MKNTNQYKCYTTATCTDIWTALVPRQKVTAEGHIKGFRRRILGHFGVHRRIITSNRTQYTSIYWSDEVRWSDSAILATWETHWTHKPYHQNYDCPILYEWSYHLEWISTKDWCGDKNRYIRCHWVHVSQFNARQRIQVMKYLNDDGGHGTVKPKKSPKDWVDKKQGITTISPRNLKQCSQE